MAKIPSDFGSGGSYLTPHGGGEPSLLTVLTDIAADINVAAASRAAALVALSTPAATDLPTTETLTNAIKTAYNGPLTVLLEVLEGYFGAKLTAADVAAITTVNATDQPSAAALLNVIKGKYNGELLTLTTALLLLTPTATAPNITAIATANADPATLATCEALANAIEGKYNGELLTLVNNLRSTIGAFPTKTRVGH